MWSFCNRASIAKACSNVDDTVNKTPLWLHLDLKLNCRHMLHCTLSWSEFYFFPPQLCLSKDFPHTFPGDVEIKRRENPAKHSSPVLCQGAIPRQKKPHTSEVPQVLKLIFLLLAITTQLPYNCFSFIGIKGKVSEKCVENAIFVFVFPPSSLPLVVVLMSLEGEQLGHG